MTELSTTSSTGLEVQQVLLEAKNHWKRITHSNREALEVIFISPSSTPGFSARNALMKVQVDDYPGDPLWEAVDWIFLEDALIRLIDAELAPNTSYNEQMQIRNRKLVPAD